MSVGELRALLERLIANGADPEELITLRFHDVDTGECFVGGLVEASLEFGCADEEGLVLSGSNDPEDFEKTEPDKPIRTLRLVT